MVPYAKIGLILFPLFFFSIFGHPFKPSSQSPVQSMANHSYPLVNSLIYTIFIPSFKQVISAHYVTLLPR